MKLPEEDGPPLPPLRCTGLNTDVHGCIERRIAVNALLIQHNYNMVIKGHLLTISKENTVH